MKRLASDALPWSGASSIGVWFAPVPAFYKAIVAAAALATSTVASARLAYRDYERELSLVKRNDMYFYYRARKKLDQV